MEKEEYKKKTRVYLYWAWNSSCTKDPAERRGDGPSMHWSSASIGS